MNRENLNIQNNKKVFDNCASDIDYFEANKSVVRNHLRQDSQYDDCDIDKIMIISMERCIIRYVPVVEIMLK